MKKVIIVFMCLGFIACVWATPDPNTPIVPPFPGTENYSIVNDNTLRVTTSVDVKKIVLIRQRKKLLLEIDRLRAKIAIINAKLAEFK